MNPTTQHFQWIDRDTAARNLLQLAYHAPEYIRNQAWEILRSIRSLVIIPELRELALGESDPHASYAFSVITATPGNIYFPEFKPDETTDLRVSQIMDLVALLQYHPINQEWVLPFIERASQKEQLRLLWMALDYIPDIIIPRLTAFYDKNSLPLELNTSLRLYETGNKDLRDWLQTRWDELIYLCLIYSADRKTKWRNLFPILDQWPELKADLFRRCPVMEDEIRQQKEVYEKKQAEANDVSFTPKWKKTELLFEQVLKGDENAFKALRWQTLVHTYDAIPQGALATYFLGKLIPQNSEAIERCLNALRYDQSIWFIPEEYYELNTCSPVRYEAASALSEIATPVVWEEMVEAYFMCPTHELARFLRPCIARMTDQLSGIISDLERPDEWDVNNRPWFRVLTEPNPESQAMYAEYYGVEKTD